MKAGLRARYTGVDASRRRERGGSDSGLCSAEPGHFGPQVRWLRNAPQGRLPESVVKDFEKWIEMGAPDPREGEAAEVAKAIDFDKAAQLWAFRPPVKAPLPTVRDTSWPKNEIDHFVLARIEQESLHPVRPASKQQLIRRATFDLLGLPPTPQEVAAFVADDSPNAYAQLIDRLLESPHYGERWGRHWLDVARFADDQAHTFAVKPIPRRGDIGNGSLKRSIEISPTTTLSACKSPGTNWTRLLASIAMSPWATLDWARFTTKTPTRRKRKQTSWTTASTR